MATVCEHESHTIERTRDYAHTSPCEEYLPTPEEIAAECRKIRESWSERDHWRRAGFANGRHRWEPRTHRVNRGLLGFLEDINGF